MSPPKAHNSFMPLPKEHYFSNKNPMLPYGKCEPYLPYGTINDAMKNVFKIWWFVSIVNCIGDLFFNFFNPKTIFIFLKKLLLAHQVNAHW